MLKYMLLLNTQREASDPYKELANAIVETAADDYRSSMREKISKGLDMSDLELYYLNSRISEIKRFFESDWGDLCAHGMALAIWERLQKEFAAQNAAFEIKLKIRKELAKAEKERMEHDGEHGKIDVEES